MCGWMAVWMCGVVGEGEGYVCMYVCMYGDDGVINGVCEVILKPLIPPPWTP